MNMDSNNAQRETTLPSNIVPNHTGLDGSESLPHRADILPEELLDQCLIDGLLDEINDYIYEATGREVDAMNARVRVDFELRPTDEEICSE